MNKRTKTALISFVTLIALASQIPLSFAPSFSTATITSSGTIASVNPGTMVKKFCCIYATLSISDATASFIASHFDLVDTGFDLASGASRIKYYNPNIKIIAYVDPTSTASFQPYWTTVNANENWFLHDTSGNRVMVYTNSYVMDVSSPGWRNFISQYAASQLATYPQYDGIFADNVFTASVLDWGIFSVPKSSLPANIMNNWNTYMLGNIQNLKTAIGGKLLISNICEWNSALTQASDGVLLEHYLHRGYYAPADFSGTNPILEMQWLENVTASGKIAVPFPYATMSSSPSTAEIEQHHQCMLYCLAGALLAGNGNTYYGYQLLNYNYIPAGSLGYESYWAEMDSPIGTPVGARYAVAGTSSSLWTRDFTNGKVYLDISNSASYTVTVGGTSYTILPRSGLIIPT